MGGHTILGLTPLASRDKSEHLLFKKKKTSCFSSPGSSCWPPLFTPSPCRIWVSWSPLTWSSWACPGGQQRIKFWSMCRWFWKFDCYHLIVWPMVNVFENINKDNIFRDWVRSGSWWWSTSGMGPARAGGLGLSDLLTRVSRGRWREGVVTRMSKYLLVIRICKIIYYQVLSKQHLIDGAICDIKIPDDKKRVSHFSPIRYLVGLLTKDNFNQKGTFDKLVPRKESSHKARSRPHIILVTTTTTGGSVPFSSRRTFFHRKRKMDCF